MYSVHIESNLVWQNSRCWQEIYIILRPFQPPHCGALFLTDPFLFDNESYTIEMFLIG